MNGCAPADIGIVLGGRRDCEAERLGELTQEKRHSIREFFLGRSRSQPTHDLLASALDQFLAVENQELVKHFRRTRSAFWYGNPITDPQVGSCRESTEYGGQLVDVLSLPWDQLEFDQFSGLGVERAERGLVRGETSTFDFEKRAHELLTFE